MQTFLPCPGFRASAALLDDRRLGKQRVEVLQVLRALTWTSYGWRNHPAVRMWRGFVPGLVAYGLAVCDEWVARGRVDAVGEALLGFTAGRTPDVDELAARGQLPPWLGHDPVHASHRSALVRKDPEHYRSLFPDVPDDLPYVWPRAAFPRWPVRRGHAEALDLPAALALLGLDEARPEQERAVVSVAAGRDAEVALLPGAGATTAGLLAGLCTPGTTAWVTPGPSLGPEGPRPEPGPPVEGSVRSPTIARDPTPEDAAAVAEEAAAEPEFAFLHPGQLTRASLDGVGLVVLDGSGEPGAQWPTDVSDVSSELHGVPVLRLRTVPVPPAEEAQSAGPGRRGRRPR
ncbi:MAG TPA: MSMEG_6728 family protein [Motilibacteraceae bacterium]|nr:MSMEG_6728 family protein [Motilibacteraceae bacterium]